MKHQATKVSGGCLCGRVRYEAEVFLQNGYICHCTICQRSTGQPAEITVLIKAGTLRYLQGRAEVLRLVAGRKARLLRPLRITACLAGTAGRR